MKTNLYICGAKDSCYKSVNHTKHLRAYPCCISTPCSYGSLARLGVRPIFFNTF